MSAPPVIACRLLGLLAALALAAPAQAQLGGLGRMVRGAQKVTSAAKAMKDIGEAEEIELGGDLAGMLMGAAPLLEDPARQRYVNRVGRWLASHSERPNLPWKFGIIDTSSVNAFSTPGGYVLITSGMLEQLRSESELADVLAHEIAHVVKRHHLKALQRQHGNSPFGEVTRRVSGGGVVGRLTSRLVDSGRELFARGLDKNDEYEADRMGVVIAARSGYSPYGMVGVLQTLGAMQTASRAALISKTHPTANHRIERLDRAMGTRFDRLPGLVDDLPGFAATLNPSVAAPPPSARPTPRRRGRT